MIKILDKTKNLWIVSTVITVLISPLFYYLVGVTALYAIPFVVYLVYMVVSVAKFQFDLFLENKRELLEEKRRLSDLKEKEVKELEETRKLEEDKILNDEMNAKLAIELEQERIMLSSKVALQCPVCKNVELVIADFSDSSFEYRCEKCGGLNGVYPTFEIVRKTEII
jgi:ribosomal protein S27E